MVDWPLATSAAIKWLQEFHERLWTARDSRARREPYMASFNKEFIKRVTPVLEPAGFHRNVEHAMRFERSVAGHLHIVDADLATRVREARLYLGIDNKPFSLDQVGLRAERACYADSPEARTAAAELMAVTLRDAGMRFFANPYSQTRAEWSEQAEFRIFDYNLTVCTLRRLPDWNKTRATLRLMHNSIALGVDVLHAIDTMAADGVVSTKAMSRFDAYELRDKIKDSGVVLETPAWEA